MLRSHIYISYTYTCLVYSTSLHLHIVTTHRSVSAGLTGRLSRLHLFADSVTDEVLLQIPLGRLRRPRLYIFGINFEIMRRTTVPNAGDSHGGGLVGRIGSRNALSKWGKRDFHIFS